MSEEAAFLSAICAEPADDTARLVYADWLQEHEQPERAEFIRVQIELAKLEAEEPPQCVDPAYRMGFRLSVHKERKFLADFLEDETPCRCALCLSHRVKELLCGSRDQQAARRLRPEWAGEMLTGYVLSWTYYRGFVAQVGCIGDQWAAHAERITLRQPVEIVSLTSWPRFVRDEHQSPAYKARCRLEGRYEWVPIDEGEHVPSAILSALWPRIRFAPPVSVHNLNFDLLFGTPGPLRDWSAEGKSILAEEKPRG